MRALISLLVIGSAASLAVAQEPRQRVEYSAGLFSGAGGEGVVLAAASSSCTLSETNCESGCMPIGSVCCKDGTNTYCPINSVCNPGGCCPIGKTCKGGSGVASCAAGKTTCGIGCMPSSADCCSDGTYCPLGSKCSGSDHCCKIGKTCPGDSGSGGSGSGSGSGSSGSGSSPGTSSLVLGSDDETTTSRRATSTFAPGNLSTATSKLSIPAAQTASDDTPTTTTSSKTPTVGPPTVTVTPTGASLPGGTGAGALDKADGKLAVGLAVVAALLI
ncbi:hypothetical protein PG996_012920 [Apiospora saccharicola]|uniref:GPI anchored protein n=1 Tax=Apiospora saccharicola TaxID=335842 RepID=A0ABR1U415_9PEZI